MRIIAFAPDLLLTRPRGSLHPALGKGPPFAQGNARIGLAAAGKNRYIVLKSPGNGCSERQNARKGAESLRKLNCWEFRRCGREPAGRNAGALGVCPAAVEVAADGKNGGKNGGRACWAVAGTYCRGEAHGTFARKFNDCMECDFFWLVAAEEEEFTPSAAFQSAGRAR